MRVLNTSSFTGRDGLTSDSTNLYKDEKKLWDTRERTIIPLRNYSNMIDDDWQQKRSDLVKLESPILYSTEMEEIYSIVKQIFKNSEKDNFNSEKFQDVKEILDLSIRYTNEFYKFSHSFEKWAARRRMSIKMLHESIINLNRTQLYCNEGRFVLSSFSFGAAIGSIALSNMNTDWSTKMFFAAASAGVLSLVSNVIELHSSKSNIQNVLRALQEDKECFELLERNILYSAVDEDISDMFPYGVDKRIAIEISNFALLGSNYSKESSSRTDFSSLSVQEQICFAILLSNVRIDPNLLKDEGFIGKVRTFSKSSLAVKWWNRLKYKHLWNHAEKKKLNLQLKSYLKTDLLSTAFISLFTFPLYGRNYLILALCTAILSGVITFETYCQLFISNTSSETSTLIRLQRILRKEYKELNKIYDALSPHND